MQMQLQNEQRKIDLFAGLIIKERKNLDKKETDLYQVEFSIQKCEMKLERIRRGQERDKAEIERKQKRIDELQVSLNEKTATSKLLHSQVINLEVLLFSPLMFSSKFFLLSSRAAREVRFTCSANNRGRLPGLREHPGSRGWYA